MFSILALLCCTIALSNAGTWRVINGTDAIMHEYPSIVSLRIQNNHFCGGTLLNNQTVLTAAHCVFPFRSVPPRNFQHYQMMAVLGEHKISQRTGKERYSYFAEFVYPSAYNHEQAFVYGNDIALIHLATPIRQESHVKMVNIPRQDENINDGDICTVVGWGSMNPDGRSTANVLQKGDLETISNDDCSRVFYYTRNNPSNVCAWSGHLSTSACKGDSGGPLFCRVNDKQVQVGVVSYGRVPCGQSNTPTVFTRVSHFVDWINQNKF